MWRAASREVRERGRGGGWGTWRQTNGQAALADVQTHELSFRLADPSECAVKSASDVQPGPRGICTARRPEDGGR